MAKLNNFETNINSLNETYKKYMVSRVIDNPRNALLQIQMPTVIPETFTVEMQFYSLVDNALMTTLVLDSSEDADVFTADTFTYADTTTRTLLYVDFSKVTAVLDDIEGRCEVVLNFFVPEIGTYYEPQLIATNISPSRTEIELSLAPTYDTNENIQRLVNFASPRVTPEWVTELMKFICNQPNVNLQIPTDTTKLTFDIIKEFFPENVRTVLNAPSTDPAYVTNISTSVQQLLNSTYLYATASINTYTENNTVFTDTLLMNIFSASLSAAHRTYTQPTQYTLL